MAPPGASGTMMRTGRLGHFSWPIAGAASFGNRPEASAKLPADLIKLRRPMIFTNYPPWDYLDLVIVGIIAQLLPEVMQNHPARRWSRCARF